MVIIPAAVVEVARPRLEAASSAAARTSEAVPQADSPGHQLLSKIEGLRLIHLIQGIHMDKIISHLANLPHAHIVD